MKPYINQQLGLEFVSEEKDRHTFFDSSSLIEAE